MSKKSKKIGSPRDTETILYAAFSAQRANANRGKIKFCLNFSEWLGIWKRSKRFSKRGRGKDQYAMSRIGDRGPYAVGNVRIILRINNTREAWSNKTDKEVAAWRAAAAKGGRANCGRIRKDLSALNQSRLGQKLSSKHRRNIAIAMTGKTRGPYKIWKGVPR